MWFHRSYSGNPICSPTRASLQTGRVPARTCIYGVEQRMLCRAGVGGCKGSCYSLANATRDSGEGDAGEGKGGGSSSTKSSYLSGFYGKVRRDRERRRDSVSDEGET